MKVGMTKKRSEADDQQLSGAYCIFHASDHGGEFHLAFAFPMIQKILMLYARRGSGKYFVIVTIGCYLVF